MFTGSDAALLVSIVLFSTGHWIGATVALLPVLVEVIREIIND